LQKIANEKRGGGKVDGSGSNRNANGRRDPSEKANSPRKKSVKNAGPFQGERRKGRRKRKKKGFKAERRSGRMLLGNEEQDPWQL